jgi:hypothetical protein
MTKKNYTYIFIPVICLTFLFSVISVFALNPGDCNSLTGHFFGTNGTDTAQLCYVALQPNAFPGVTSSNNNLSTYLGNIFDLGIALAVVLALIMIIWGGIIKMTTDSWNKQDEAKSKIENALYGLGLALISYVLLYTINPALVTWQGNTLLGGGSASSGADATIRSQLASDGITINKADCPTQTSTNCTSLDGLPSTAVTGLESLQTSCKTASGGTGCVVVTGGTEAGHVSHGQGIATVDVRYNSQVYAALQQSGLTYAPNFAGGSGVRGNYTCEAGGSVAVPCDGSSAVSIHIQF